MMNTSVRILLCKVHVNRCTALRTIGSNDAIMLNYYCELEVDKL